MTKIPLAACLLILASASAQAATLDLRLRSRAAVPQKPGQLETVEKAVHWDPHKTAVVICDMWDRHWCKSATARVAEMAPRMNEVIARLRDQGVLVLHCPSETMRFYEGHPARKRALAAPAVTVPKAPRRKETPLPITVLHGGCTDDPPCPQGAPWKRQIATLEIKDVDGITDDGNQAYNLMRQQGVENMIIMGVHTNMCVLGRSFAIKAMVNRGMNVSLMRDMTDTMYRPEGAPRVDHFTGTDLVVAWIEANWCPTFTSDQVLGGRSFRFAADTRSLSPFAPRK